MSNRQISSAKERLPLGRVTKSLPEQVADQLVEMIHDGECEPGERLKEEVLAERFAVSRTTIREAINTLERRGMIERVPRYGARVKVIDAAEVEEIFGIRAQLLGLAARMVAEKGSDDTLARFAGHIERLRQLADKESTAPATYARASIEAQHLLVSDAGWKQLSAIYEGLSSQALWRISVRGKSISFKTVQRRRESAADWQRICEAVLARDPEQAELRAKALLHASYLAAREWL